MWGGLTILASLALAAWLGLAFARGGFWRADRRLSDPAPGFDAWPAVVAVIPARNEAPFIGRAVASLLGQDYPGRLTLIVVDDRSTDGTRDAASAAAVVAGAQDRCLIVPGEPLPQGWAGKMWAVEQGVRRAAALADAPYLLLTDADIEHDRHNLRRLIAQAESGGFDLVSLMVKLNCTSAWERLLIPAFVFFFQMLYPFARVARPDSRVAAAAGGCMLVRRSALAHMGGIEAIRSAIIDDCALARMIKSQGGTLWLGLSETVGSIRPYDTLDMIWRMVARSAYTQLKYSPLLLAGTVVGMLAIFIAPPLVAIAGALTGHWPAALLAAAAWTIMGALYLPTLALYGASSLRAATLPAAAAFYLAMTVDSALRHWRGQGGAWKDRTYSSGLGAPL